MQATAALNALTTRLLICNNEALDCQQLRTLLGRSVCDQVAIISNNKGSSRSRSPDLMPYVAPDGARWRTPFQRNAAMDHVKLAAETTDWNDGEIKWNGPEVQQHRLC